MSYCSKCGVSLSATEVVCPLCGKRIYTRVDDRPRAYPLNCEAVPLSSTRTALMGLIILLFPALCCFAVDILEDRFISWVMYIWGGEACFYTYIFLPKLFNKPKTSLLILASSAVTSGYLFLIGFLSGSGQWVLPLGLPVTFMSGAMVFAIYRTINIKKASQLFKSAVIILYTGFFAMAAELVIDIFLYGAPTFGWTLPVLLPLVCLSAAMFYLEYDSELKKRLLRAVFL